MRFAHRFDFILDQVKAYESKLQQQQTQFEEKTKQFDEVSSEKGNFISKVIYHFNDGNVFVCAFQNSLREKKENTDEGIVHTYHNPDRQN
jgi:hypothetical protein